MHRISDIRARAQNSYGFTVNVVFAETVPEVAVMVVAEADVTDCAVASPVALIVAASWFDEFQVTELVMSGVLPSCR